MDQAQFLTETESAVRAGVSVATLKQFVQFGFISAHERDGRLFFKPEELRLVFATDLMDESDAEETSVPQQDKELGEDATQVDRQAAVEPIPDNSTSADQLTSEPIIEPQIDIESPDETTLSEQADQSSVSQYEVLALNRRLREEIRMLREERDWLRGRLEKLESRSERDQMLLLSESQTIKALVTQKERRSFWQTLALPWNKS